MAKEFDESKHPRDEDGKFTDGNGGKHYRQNASYGEILAQDRKESEGNYAGFSNSPTNEFVASLSKAKATYPPEDAWRVSSPSSEEFDEEHPNAKRYVTEGGSTVAITPDGDIVGVCKEIGDTLRGRELLEFAVMKGGNKLDAFSGLFGFYSKYGFEPVSWTPFDERYAPPGWEKERDKPEPIIFWKYTGKKTEYEDSEDFLSKTKPSDSYDAAKKLRDEEVKQ